MYCFGQLKLTVKGMVRLILAPTLATYLCLRKRGRRTLGRSGGKEKIFHKSTEFIFE